MERPKKVLIIGAGFSGLAAAYELTRRGVAVDVIEQESEIGGLAGSFPVGGHRLEKFYHHWFTSDHHVMALIDELGCADQVTLRPTKTGMYFANTIYRLSSPIDVLRFTPLTLIDRLRLGMMVLRARRIEDWTELESLTAAEWLRRIGGEATYRTVWQPLLRGKFGPYADEVSAVWFWNKLKLRGGSRGKGAAEMLGYYKGGFGALADRIVKAIESGGGIVRTGTSVEGLVCRDGKVTEVRTTAGPMTADAVIATPALPIVAEWLAPYVEDDYVRSLRRIDYLANVCLVLQLDRSLSDTYWLNVNDPHFPYVGIIEHTNFDPPEHYSGRHIVYLSKYTPDDGELWCMNDDEVFEFSLPHIGRMFPHFRREWVKAYHVWRARYAQPVVVRHFGKLIPAARTPLTNFYLCSMAQVYPEDRGTNYAIREGRKVAALVAQG